MEILENQSYEMNNVISYRNKMTAVKLQQVMTEVKEFLDKNDLCKDGYLTTTTFSVEIKDNVPLMDIEILCPVNREISVPVGFTFKPKFRLLNALKATHKGNPVGLQQAANEFQSYMAENGLTPITSLYNVTVIEAKSQTEVDDMVVDMYIGVTENML
jgi:effector-binding domain-containing protein